MTLAQEFLHKPLKNGGTVRTARLMDSQVEVDFQEERRNEIWIVLHFSDGSVAIAKGKGKNYQRWVPREEEYAQT